MEPLVVIPGFMADARGFMPQIVELGRGRPILILMPLKGDTVEQISLALTPELPPKFSLLGHGLGGSVAIDLLRRLPDRVTRLALIATDPLAEPPAAIAAREARLVSARAGRLADALGEEIPARALAGLPWRGEVLALMQDMGLGLGPEAFRQQTRAMQRRPDQQKTLRKVRVPALILAGEADNLVPLRRQEFLSQLMPFGRLQVIESAGHLPQLENPEAVNAALGDFLAGPLPLR